MSWRVALIDSCGDWPGAVGAAAFETSGEAVLERSVVVDPTGHGSRIASVLTGGPQALELLLGQVFTTKGPTTGAAVARAIDWAVDERARLVHLSLGLNADRAPLARAVDRAVGRGCVVVASVPARGSPVYPGCYPGVIRATGDARCAPGEWSALGEGVFGACPRVPDAHRRQEAGGASVGAAWLSRAILGFPGRLSVERVIQALTAGATYAGRESRGSQNPV